MNYYDPMRRYGSYEDMRTRPVQVSNVDPYVVSALMTLIGNEIVVETVRGSLNGKLMDVKPDHIVLGERYDDSKFFIRIAEIVHIMPIGNNSCYPKLR